MATNKTNISDKLGHTTHKAINKSQAKYFPLLCIYNRVHLHWNVSWQVVDIYLAIKKDCSLSLFGEHPHNDYSLL